MMIKPKVLKSLRKNFSEAEQKKRVKQGLNHSGFVITVAIEDGSILMLRKNDPKSKNHEKFELPGGTIDEGETIAEGTAREFCEEARANLESMSPIFYKSLSSKNKDRAFFITFVSKFKPDLSAPQVNGRREHTDFKWFDIDDLKSDKANDHHYPVLIELRDLIQELYRYYRKEKELPAGLQALSYFQ